MCSEPSPLDTGTCQLWQGQLLGHAKGNTQPCLACPQEEWASPDRRWHPRKAFKFRSAEGTGPGGYSMYMCGVLGNAGVPPAAGGPVRFISPTPLSDGQQSGCAGQTPSLPWGWSRCAGVGLDLECSSQLEAVKMNNGSASWKTACGVRDF